MTFVFRNSEVLRHKTTFLEVGLDHVTSQGRQPTCVCLYWGYPNLHDIPSMFYFAQILKQTIIDKTWTKTSIQTVLITGRLIAEASDRFINVFERIVASFIQSVSIAACETLSTVIECW